MTHSYVFLKSGTSDVIKDRETGTEKVCTDFPLKSMLKMQLIALHGYLRPVNTYQL